MILSASSPDCTPLAGPIDARLSDSDLRRIEPLQRTLLSPLDYRSVDEWRRAVNRTTMAVFRSDAAMFQLDMMGIDLQYSEEFDTAHTSQYVEEMMPRFAMNQRLYRRAERLKAGNRSLIWGRDLEWLYDSAYFNELVVTMQAFDPLWMAAPGENGRYPAMLHTYHDRRQSKHYFGAADVALVRSVQPALEAGIRTLRHVAASRASVERILEDRREGALVYDVEGRLLHRSRTLGERLKASGDEQAALRAGREMALGLFADDNLDRLARQNVHRTVSAPAGDYRMTAVLLGEGVFTLGPAVLITIAVGAAPLPARALIRERFGLTRRQAEVALLLAERRTNPEIAEQLFISEHTVRSHTEAVMQKLGLHDRREIRQKLTGG